MDRVRIPTNKQIKNKKSKESHRAEEYNNLSKNYLSGFSIRLDEAEKQISNLEDRAMKCTQIDQQINNT